MVVDTNDNSLTMLLYATLFLACIAIILMTVISVALALYFVFSASNHKASENQKLIETENALRISQERFQLAGEASNGLWDWDIKTDAVYYSPRFKELLGFADNELENSLDAWKTRLHPDDIASTLAAVDAHLKARAPFRVRYRLLCKSGSYRWFHARGQANWDATGKPTRMAGSITDISEQIEAELARESSQRLYLSLVENLPVFLIRKDTEGRFTFANQAFCKQLGKPLEEIRGTTDYDHYPRSLAQKYRDDDQHVVDTGELFEDVEDYIDSTGHYYFEVLKTQVTDATGAVVGTQAICWDVTARKTAEIALNEAKLTAEQANRAKSDFLANMSHEIRTPMNAIIGMTELVLETQLAPEQREYLISVMEAGESLLTIINEILDFSKIEAGRLQLECTRFDLRDMLGSALKSLGVRAHRKGLELIWHCNDDVPRFVMGDPTRLRQVVFNIVGNAIKFTNIGEVLLTVRNVCSEHTSTLLEFSVMDSGVGIAVEHQEKIFQAFHQADASTTRQFGGTGLGLTISRRLVQLMGGDLHLESTVGKGSVFRFQLRFEIAGDDSYDLVADTSRLQETSVLVVDDNATNRRIMVELLTAWGMRVFAVESALQALNYLRSLDLSVTDPNRPVLPLLISDYQMPQMDGCMLIAEIRKDVRFRHMKVIVLSSSVGIPQSAISELGISVFLQKPVKQSELFDSILSAVRVDEPVRIIKDPEPSVIPSLRVLLAEDGEANRKLAIGLLTRWGHSVEIAENGVEAVEKWADGAFDVILMDVQMPIMDGLQATRTIREREMGEGRHIPIIAVTAHAMTGDRDKCLAAGMNGYVTKPFKKQNLYDAILPLIQQDPTHATH